ncbi:MAG: HipA N-terminal domain-containing protein [Bacteroidota bacterium]
MERKAEVYINDQLAGYLIQTDEEYVFKYEDAYFSDDNKPAISLTLPKSTKEYHSKYLFPFFFGLLSEGDLKTLQCRNLGIDENDHFTRLLKTAQNTIGAVRIKEAI